MISIAKKWCLLTYHMLFPRLLRSGGLQLLQVLELGVEFVHPVGFPLVRHLVFLQEFQGSFAALKPLHNLTTKTSLNQTQVWQSHNHTFYFRGFAGFARLLSSRVVCVVVYAKVPWLSLHAKYRGSKAKQAAALLYFGSNTHTTQEESADSSRRNVAGPILYCHRYKITCDNSPNIMRE